MELNARANMQLASKINEAKPPFQKWRLYSQYKLISDSMTSLSLENERIENSGIKITEMREREREKIVYTICFVHIICESTTNQLIFTSDNADCAWLISYLQCDFAKKKKQKRLY